jgi:hypothetical protein
LWSSADVHMRITPHTHEHGFPASVSCHVCAGMLLLGSRCRR